MVVLGMWLLIGVVFGMILMAFLAIGTYQRGYDDGFFLRKPWRAEFAARRYAQIVARKREMTAPARVRISAAPAPAAHSRVAGVSAVAASGG
jgi:hypothetical protein